MDGHQISREIAFSQPVINIGADSGNDIVLRGNNVADFHAMLHYDADRWYVMPLNGISKTTVNNRVIDDTGSSLQNGSVLGIGDYSLTLMLNGISTDILIRNNNSTDFGPVSNGDSVGANILLEITENTAMEIDAGASAEVTLTVTNAGPLVANMQLQVQGVPSAWLQIIPPVVNLNEGRKGQFTVRISPPRDPSSKAGYYNLHFVASSPNYQGETGVVNSSVTILPYSEYLVNGPTPRTIVLTRRNVTDIADVVVMNNSNARSDFYLRSYDDSNGLNFSYERGNSMLQSQEMVTVDGGDNARITTRIGAKKMPIFSFRNHNYHYYISVTPSDQPTNTQSVMGEVIVKPLINTFWLYFLLLLAIVSLLFLLQPYIIHFESPDGLRTQVLLYGSSTKINWDVMNVTTFAGKVTLDDGSGPQDISRNGSQFFAPTKSTTYTLKAENLFSRLIGITHERSIQILVIPQRPSINTFMTDHSSVLYNQQVNLTWAVGDTASKAIYYANKQGTDLTPETYSGSLVQGYTADTLFSLRAENDSGYEMKSLFLNVQPNKIDLKRFTVWVRPNGIAVPNDNDSRRTTRWSALQLALDASGVMRPSVNPQPAPQTNVLEIPDNFNNTTSGEGRMNPEEMMRSGVSDTQSGYVYQTPMATADPSSLLVSPQIRPVVTPTAIPETSINTDRVITQPVAPATSPQSTYFNPDFTIKLVEIVEDPLEQSGYRLIDYFPGYQLQPGEQVLVEWNVEGVNKIKIENLTSDDLNSSGGSYAYPDKSVTYEMKAVIGELEKSYSLPVRVAGAADDGEGSGLKCDLKASATTLKVPGTVMLSWTGGGTNRVQLVSSAQAEKENADAEKKKEAEAKEKGQSYTAPTNPALSGGAIGDWLQPSGFMRVNVDKQTTFVLNAYDGNGNVICTKSVDVKLEGGNDKTDISDVPGASFKIIRIADDNDVVQDYYTVGQNVHYTIEFAGFPSGKEPTGSVQITDGTSTCSVTLPVTTCAFQAKKAGNLTITAVYSGDNVYNRATTTAKETVINKLETTIEIQAALKPAANLANLVTQLKFDTENQYKLIPTGTITLTAGNSTCDLDVITDKLTCEGSAVEVPEDGYWWTIKDMLLSDPAADRITAAYKGDDYFLPSTSTSVLFMKIPTTSTIKDDPLPHKVDSTHADFTSVLAWDWGAWLEGGTSITGSTDMVASLLRYRSGGTDESPEYRYVTPTGTLTFTSLNSAGEEKGQCVYDFASNKLSCEGTIDITDNSTAAKPGVNEEFKLSNLLVAADSDRIKVDYSGDALFNASSSTTYIFETLPTTLTLSGALKPAADLADVVALLTYDEEKDHDLDPKGTITFTVGSGTCVLTIDDPEKLQLSCNGEVVKTENIQEYKISNMQLADPTASTIKAEYSGDGFFQPSASDEIAFFSIDTKTIIDTAVKYDASHVSVKSEVTWDPEKNPDGYVPAGTITYTIGTGTCVLDFTDPDELKFSCGDNDITDIIVDMEKVSDGKIIFTINKMLIADNTADRITAAYSGDSHFNPSTSTAFVFMKVDTVTEILEAYKPVASIANIINSLTRNEDDWKTAGCTDTGISCPEMTGTLTYTITNPAGNQTCVLDIVKQTMDCSGTVSVENDNYSILNVLLSSQDADRVKIVYSGDAFYNTSTASETLFNRVLTETVISDASKRTEGEDNRKFADFTVEVSWLDAPKEGAAPTGTLTFLFGDETCDIDMVTGEGVGEHACTVSRISKYGSRFVVEGLALGDQDPDSITAAYSGDSAFHPSTSQPWEFGMIDTEIVIERAFKPNDTMANLVALLTCVDVSPEECTPTGTVTFIASNSMVDTATCIHKLGVDKEDPDYFSCRGTIADDNYEFTVENMPIGQISADRIRVLYSGDGTFNPSTSKMVMFKTVGTSINIKDASKTTDSVVSMTTDLIWDEFVSGGVRPSGTIKYTSGSRTCTLDISGDPFRFTDCDGSAEYTYSEEDKKLSITITRLPMTGAGETIKAEYSGSGAYLASVSPDASFGKINSELEIVEKSTYKTDSSHASVAADLIWKIADAGEANPAGTVNFTIGKTVCTLDFIANTLSGCEAEKFNVSGPVVDPDDEGLKEYHLSIENILLEDNADRVKAEYSGDSLFNPSSDTALFSTLETEITIINDETYKPYRPDTGYANFNFKLTWDESEAGGRTPSGTITFTPANSDACVYTIGGKLSCEGTVTVVYVDPDDHGKGIDHYEVRNMLMSNAASDRIKADYSGDGSFESSSSTTVLFDMSDTSTKITSAAKSPSGEVDMTVSISATKDYPDEPRRAQLGTLVITSGSATCTLDISTDSPRFTDCEGSAVLSDGSYRITGLQMGDGTGNTIKARYSGDSYFRGSVSPEFDFLKVNTALVISKAYKPGSPNRANVTATLSWNKDEAGANKPRGSITFTIGADKCVLDIDAGTISCKGDGTAVNRETSVDDNSYTWVIENILLSADTADRVLAEYGGDSIFNASSSNTVLFKTVPTDIHISKAFKVDNDYADITAVLGWDESLAEGRLPSGTITIKAGSGSCTLDIETKVLSCEPKSGTVSDDRKTYSVSNMLLDDKTADRVQVEYSGDGFFLASTSTKVLFDTIPTDLNLYDGSRTQAGVINVKADLSWINESPDGRKPTGTIKFTSGTAVCTLDISTMKFTDCVGVASLEEEVQTQTYTITNLNMGSKAGADIKAEYSGDGGFLASASDPLSFEKMDTELKIDESATYKSGDSLLNIAVDLYWDKEQAGGQKTTGTVVFTVGSGTCTLDILTSAMDCESKKPIVIKDTDEGLRIEIEEMLLADNTADRVKAAYSGDSIFNPSYSTVMFKTVATELRISNAYRPDTGYANFNTFLTWDESAANGKTPSGTLTFTTIYPDPLVSSKCVYSIDTGKMDCEGKVDYIEAAETVPAHYEIRRMLMNYAKADRVKAEYSGDGFFEPSSSTTVLFDTSDTSTKISNAAKSPSGVVEMLITVSTSKAHPDGRQPVGTIKITSGTKTCTMDISGENPSFTDCEGSAIFEDGKYTISGLVMGDNAGENIFAVYSGDSYFNESTSPTIDFVKADTELTIDSADKPGDPNQADVTVTLKWNKNDAEGKLPTGTISFTIGSETCVMSRMESDNPGFNCRSENTKITRTESKPEDQDNWSYTWAITNILLSGTSADRVKAEYKGDAIFNASSSDTVMFKTVPTTITISSAFKKGNTADVTALMEWDLGLANDRLPHGTLTFTAGSGSCTLDIDTGVLSCEPKRGTVSADRKSYSVINMLLDDKDADRVSVKYSGDGFFEPSESSKVLFQTIPTDLDISNATKRQPGFINLKTELSWDDNSLQQNPSGTIKFTSGTGTCTLDISIESNGAPQARFTDCEGKALVTKAGNKITYDITDLYFGGKAGDTIKADYSGDGLFLASSSDTLSFEKVDTLLDLTDVYKPEKGLANLTAELSWLKEKADESEPEGTIKLTIGSGVCTLNMDDNSFDCSGESTKVTASNIQEKTVDSQTYEYIRWTFENVLLSDTNADRVKAEYSGDAFFNSSSSVTVLFKTMPTDLTITKGDKKSSGLIDMTMELNWTEKAPGNSKPSGTIKIISGNNTCTMNLDGNQGRLTDCQGDLPVVTAQEDGTMIRIDLTNLNMGGSTGDSIKAEYSGNSIFLPSAADSLFFSKINTTLTIDPDEVYKTVDGFVNMLTSLSWNKDAAGNKKPTGTITYTIGSDSCVLNVETKAFSCSGTSTQIDGPGTGEEGSFDWVLKNILLSGTNADRVKAVYSGDGAFNPSTSLTVLFKTIETTLNISEQSKSSAGRVSMTTTLNWADTPPVKDPDADPQTYISPAGTIKWTAGSTACSLILTSDQLKIDCDPTATVSLVESDQNHSTYRIENLYMGGTVDTIQAQYSGDGCFLASESNTISFNKMNTTLTIDSSKITKLDEQTVNLNVTLASDDPNADINDMTGTIKFTLGSDTCTYNIDTGDFNCSGETTKITSEPDAENKKITWTFENVILSSGSNPDRVKAEYSGNDVFNPSTSPIIFFTKVETYLAIPSASKTNAGLITMVGEFSWTTEAPPGKKPSGTIKFISGTAACTLDVSSDLLRFTNCSGRIQANKDLDAKKYTYEVFDMDMGSNVGDDIKLEYSGDGTFQPSVSDVYSFIKVNTTLVIDGSETFRTNDDTATVSVSLNWTKSEAEGKSPTGSIKFTIGSDVCTMDVESRDFSCTGSATEISEPTVSDEGVSWILKEIMLSAGNKADRVKAEYSGDAIFNPSSSSTVLFKTIETELDISNQKKLPTGLVNLTTEITWEDTPPTGKNPAGTIRYTSGSAACTLNIATQKFTDCDGTAEITFGEKTAAIEITNLNMGKNIGNSIKAEYSGDGCYLSSVSSEEDLIFVKLIPELEITRAYKPGDPTLVNMIVTMEWNDEEAMEKVPTGTITFTMDKNTCNLTITGDPTKDTIDCSGSDTSISREDSDGKYVWTMKNVLLTDPAAAQVRAKYNGDDVFDTVTSNTRKFYTVSTAIEIISDEDEWPYKPVEGYLNFSSAMEWDPNDPALDWDMDSTKRLPTGTITYTPMAQDQEAGKCVLTISTGKLSCGGTVSGSVIQYDISRMLLSNFKADRIKAEYSGDGFFEPSISTVVLLKTSDTATTITDAEKDSSGKVSMNITVKGTLDHPDGTQPLGTITITSGSKNCTLSTKDGPDKAKFLECNGKISYDAANDVYRITELEMGTDIGETINAVYSGDNAFFNASTSPAFNFKTVSTGLSFIQAYRPAAGYASFDAQLSWDPVEADGREPSGTIKFTVGSGTCTLTLSTKALSCEATEVDYDPAAGSLTIKDMLLDDNTADRIKAEYSGDGFFLPSASTTVLFKTSDTATNISDLTKSAAGVVNMTVTITPAEAHPDGRDPQGTIKFTSGSKTCTMDISSNTPKFTDCDFAEIKIDEGKYVITGLVMGSDAGTNIKADYSGDSYFNPSTSPTVDFLKLDTFVYIATILKSGASTADIELYMVWDKHEDISDVPSGPIKLTIGSDTCNMNPSDLTIDCSGLDTYIELTDDHAEYGLWGWQLHNVLLSSGSTPDRAKAEYGGDTIYNPSASPTVMFTTVPTTLAITLAEKPDGSHANVNAELTWNEDQNIVHRAPTGTVKYTIGSGSCTLTLGTNTLDCEQGGVKVDSSTVGKLQMEILAILLDDKSADRIYAEYSGDGYFLPSTSTRVPLNKVDVTLEITKITDESGAEHKFYTPGQTVRIETNFADSPNPAPTGTISVSIDTASCTISLPQNTCTLTLSKAIGDFPVKAVYGGDSSYNSSEAEGSISIKDKQPLQLEIDKITDAQGEEHEKDDNVYSRGQEVTVSVNISGYDAGTGEIPTGDITLKVGTAVTADCDENWTDNSASCKVKLPSDSGTYEVKAEYGGSTYYDTAVSDPWTIIVDKSDVTFEIDSISNGYKGIGDKPIEQSFYVYKWTGENQGEGQDVQVCVKFDNYDTAYEPDHTKVQILDTEHFVGSDQTLIQFTTSNQLCGTFNTDRYKEYLKDLELKEPIPVKLSVKFLGDENYGEKEVEETIYVYNRLYPQFELSKVETYYDNPVKGVIEFTLSPNSDIPDQYDQYGDIILSKDNTVTPPAPDIYVTFSFRGVKYIFDLAKEKLYDVTYPGQQDLLDFDYYKRGDYYILDAVPFPAGNEGDPVHAVYDGNRYFYEAERNTTVGQQPGGFTEITLSDVMKINNPAENKNIGHMFFRADLTYDTEVSRTHEGALPEGHLVIKTVQDSTESEEITCTFTVSNEQPEGIVKCGGSQNNGTVSLQANRIHFEIRDLDVQKNAGKLKVQFKTATNFYEDSPDPGDGVDITTETRPSLAFSNSGAKKTNNTTADLEFRITGMGSLTKSYWVYNQLEIGSGPMSSESDVPRDTCILLHEKDSYGWQDEKCSGEISRTESSDGYVYTITGFTGIIKYDTLDEVFDTKAYAALRNDFGDITSDEYPHASAAYRHTTGSVSLAISDPLKYKTEEDGIAHVFLTFDVNYDADVAERYDKYPSGVVLFESINPVDNVPTRCLFDLKETSPLEGCDGAELVPVANFEEGKSSWMIYNAPINPVEATVRLTYWGGAQWGDEYYESSSPTEDVQYINEGPVIDIRNAWHNSQDEVYADFTITGMGSLSDKYEVNQAIRFTSSNGGKTCTYTLHGNDEKTFEEGCAGTLEISGTTYTLKGLTGLYTADDTQFSVKVTSEYLEESVYAHKEIDYAKLAAGIKVSNVLKVKPFKLNNRAFLTVDFTYETEVSGRYGVEPSGTLTFAASNGSGSCTYNLSTKTASGCTVERVESASSAGMIRLMVKNLIVDDDAEEVQVSYANDDYFAAESKTKAFDIKAHPGIHITNAVKITLTRADVTLVVTDAEYYANIYGSFFRQIRISSNNTQFSYINISDIMSGSAASGTAGIINGSGTVTWTKEGTGYYTFVIKDWTGPIRADDTTCYAALASSWLDLDEYPNDDEPFGHTSSWTRVSLSDAYAAEGNHVYMTAVLAYDPAIAESYDKIPTGTLTIKGSSGAADKVCAFDLSASPATFTLASDSSVSCGTVEHDAANHKATFIVRNYEGPAGARVSSVWLRYDGDDYYDQSDLMSANPSMESPTVAISYLLRSLESDSSCNGYVMFTVDGIDGNTLAGKYNVYPYIRLMRHTDSSAADYCLFDRAANTFTGYNNCHADEIIVNGNTYIFKNLNGEWDGQKIIQPRHNSFEVSLYPNIVTDRWSVTSYPMDYQLWLDRLNTSLSLPEMVKVSDRHVFVKAELTSDLNSLVVANAFGVSPTGTIHFTSGGLNCICDIDAGTCTGGCEAEVTKTVGTWPITMLVRNPTGTDVGTQIDAAYNSDRLFRYSDMTGTFVNGAPTITIDSAQKLSNTKANVTVTVHGNDYVEYYSSVYDQIRLAAHDGEYNYIENISDILRSSSTSGTATLSIGSGEVSWTKSGNDVTFTVTNWEGPIDAEDTQCTAWLLAYGLTEDQYPKASPKTFTHTKGQVTLSFDGKVLNEFNDNVFMDLVLDYDPQTAAGFQKPKGRLTLRGSSESTTCDFDLNQSTVSCEQSGCSAQVLSVDETAHKAIIRIRGFHSWNGNYIRVTGGVDDYYTYTSVTGTAERVTPEVTVLNAFKGPHQVGHAQITVKTTEDLEKFELYPRVMLFSGKNDDDAHSAAFALRAENPQFESPVTGTITGSYDPDTYTYTFMIRDMKNMIGADDTYLKAAANDTEIGSTVKSDAIDYETIYTTVTISDALVLVDAAGYEHAFGKINFSFSESGSAAKTFDFWPDGWMRVRAWANRGKYGYVNVSDPSKTVDAEDCGAFSFTSAKDETNHTYQITMKNMSVLNNTSSIQVIYNQDPYGDDLADFDGQFYKDTIFQAYETNLVSATRVKPTIDITEAKKYPVSSGSSYVPMVDVTFTVNGLSDLEPWDIFGAIRLSNDIYGVTESYIDLSTNQLMDGSGQVSRSGDTFTITGWKKLSASDTKVVISLVPKFSDIGIPNRVAELSKQAPTVSAVDVLSMDGRYFLTMVLEYDSNGPTPTGTLTIEIQGSSTSCTFNLSTDQSTCTGADVDVQQVPGRIKVLISGWQPTGQGTFPNYRVRYSGDEFYTSADSPLYSNVHFIIKPTVTMNSAYRNGTAKFTISGYDSFYSKYPIITELGLGRTWVLNINEKIDRIEILSFPVTVGNMKIERSGNDFTVTNFPDASDYSYFNYGIILNSPNNKYWDKDTIYDYVHISDGLSSGSPVTLTVGGFEPVAGE